MRGRLFSCSAASKTILSVILCKPMPLGKPCRNRPPSFSLALRCPDIWWQLTQTLDKRLLESGGRLSSFPGAPFRALRTIASFCRAHVAAQLPGNRAVTPAQASDHFPAAHAHGHKEFDPDAFFQSKMAMGHGGLLLAEWLLVLPTLPESRLVLLTLHPPTRWCIWNENLLVVTYAEQKSGICTALFLEPGRSPAQGLAGFSGNCQS